MSCRTASWGSAARAGMGLAQTRTARAAAMTVRATPGVCRLRESRLMALLLIMEALAGDPHAARGSSSSRAGSARCRTSAWEAGTRIGTLRGSTDTDRGADPMYSPSTWQSTWSPVRRTVRARV
jgi:hypothetical protein